LFLTVLRAEEQEITAQVLLKFLEGNWILLVVISFSCNTWWICVCVYGYCFEYYI